MRRSVLLQLASLLLLVIQPFPPTQAAAVAAQDTGVGISRIVNAVPPSDRRQYNQPQHQQRRLLQSSYVSTVCDTYGGSDSAAVLDYATMLLGDPRLSVTDARFLGACTAFGMASITAPHALAAQISSALILSTGNAAAAAAEFRDPSQPLSTDLQQAGDAMTNSSYTYDAAVLEVDVTVAAAAAAGSRNQLVLRYLFGSVEYGAANPNPDTISLFIRPKGSSSSAASSSSDAASSSSDAASSSSSSSSSGGGYRDIAVLPGGGVLTVPGASPEQSPVRVFGSPRTALAGFTQVIPSQGFDVEAGATYTLRLAVADANTALGDSVLMLPAGSLRLVGAPTASAGGPYSLAPNSQLTLTGAKSSSPNSAIFSYLWSITPVGSSTSSISASGPSVTMPAPSPGQYNVSLDIWDFAGGHAQNMTSLSVDAANVLDWWSATPGFAPPAASAVVPRPTAVLALNGTRSNTMSVRARSNGQTWVEFDGSGSSDGRGHPLAYTWQIAQTQPGVGLLNLMLPFQQPAKFVQSLTAGEYIVNLDVSGPGGTSSTQAVVSVAANNPPTADPGGPYTVVIGTPVVVSADKSSDPDGDELSYTWTLSKGGVTIGTYSGPALSVTLNRPGVYSVQLTADDGRGGVASAVTEVTSTLAPPSSPPVVYVPISNYAPAPVAPMPTVIAAVPAPAPAPNLRTSGTSSSSSPVGAASTGYPSSYPTGSTPAVAAAPTVYQPVYTSTPASGMMAPAGSAASPAAAPTPTMCLYTRDNSTSGTKPDASAAANTIWGSLNTLFSWTNTYWAPCKQTPAGTASPPPAPVSGTNTPPAASPAAADPLKSTAVIRSPEAFVTATGAATQVFLDATGSMAATGRSLIAFSWAVKRKSDGAVITTVDGLRTPVWLGPGVFTVALQVTDTSGQTATATKDFSIGDVAATTAFISSPDRFVFQPDGGSLDVALSATGSKAGPGRSITHYTWAVVRLPDNARVSDSEGPAATAALPVGSYRAYLAVFDSGGGNATASKDFVVGSSDASGVRAVITWPPALVQATSATEATTVALDGSGSAPASNHSTIAQYVWAVVTMPGKQPVANATGRLATVQLPAGFYQVGLLVVDSSGATATARKNFAISSTSSSVNNPPIVKEGLAFTAAAGGVLKLTGVTDPDGDELAVTWTLMDGASGKTAQGKGMSVPLSASQPGSYLLLITANDGRGGETSGTAKVTVTGTGGGSSGAAALPASGGSTSSGSRLPASSAPSPTTPGSGSTTGTASSGSTTAAAKKLPGVGLPQGSVMELDAESFGLLPAGSQLDGYTWELRQRSSGEQVATVYGRLGHFELSRVDTYDLKLIATNKKGKTFSSSGSVRVLAPTKQGFLELSPWMSFAGKCGPFASKQYASTVLSCPDLSVAGVERDQLHYAWKVFPPATSSSSSGSSGIRYKSGPKPEVFGLGPGLHRVELAIGVGGIPNNQNTAYYLATFLNVTATSKLGLKLPKPMCSGQAVQLEAPALVQPGAAEPEFEWRVTWADSQRVLGFKENMQGAGKVFGFAVQPGRYDVTLTARMADGSMLKGAGNITALPCIKCRPGVVSVTLNRGSCAAVRSQIAGVLASEPPEGAELSWHSTAVKTVGQRKVQVVAKMPTSGVAASCSATVNFRDVEPPTIKLQDPSGACLAFANSKWACWKASQLVDLADNCQSVAPLAFMVTCGVGSSPDNCKVLTDGRACVRAGAPGQKLRLRVQARDSSGNLAVPVEVPVSVRTLTTGVGCTVASLATPTSSSSSSSSSKSSASKSSGSKSSIQPVT